MQVINRKPERVDVERKELLDEILNTEMERLRKFCFKQNKRPVLIRRIEIYGHNLGDKASIYNTVPVGVNDLFYIHNIIIDIRLIDNYLYYRKKSRDNSSKEYHKEILVNAIRYELCHAFVKDYYQESCKIEGVENDASPIFLSCLLFFGYSSNQKCVDIFRKSKIYEEIIKLPHTFEALDEYLTNLILSYGNVAKRLKVIESSYGRKTYRVVNYFKFSSMEAGLYNWSQRVSDVVVNMESYIKTTDMKENTYHIGCCIEPKDIAKLERRHRYGNFGKHSYEKVYIDFNKLDENSKPNVKSVRKRGNFSHTVLKHELPF